MQGERGVERHVQRICAHDAAECNIRIIFYWGVGKLAIRSAVNGDIGGSSPPAPAILSSDDLVV